ncbi:MAG: aminotransferase class V-fold PLP-dependent enzyme [Deltaproteobacteria bacterium]|nr:aminotransferase class V-fold PLP-dependent enzyme [Deltaproteobacteria bacterium]
MIYLDHHATTPLCESARHILTAHAQADSLGNPSSIHRAGRGARSMIEQTRRALANAVGVSVRELVFTSGGTEALHFCVRACATGLSRVFVDAGAHPALVAAIKRQIPPSVKVATLPRNHNLSINFQELAEQVGGTSGLVLIAASWVQHETGMLLDTEAMGRFVDAHPRVVLLLDAIQALGKTPVDVHSTRASAVAFSGHKIGGLSGCGAAWVRADTAPVVLLDGGGQERGLRAGTENLLGIATFGAALIELPQRLNAQAEIGRRRDQIESCLLATAGVIATPFGLHRVATACHVAVRDLPGEELVAALDLEGVFVSSGPACTSGRGGASSSMLALFPGERWRARGALRVSLGPEVSDDDVSRARDTIMRVLPRVLATRVTLSAE